MQQSTYRVRQVNRATGARVKNRGEAPGVMLAQRVPAADEVRDAGLTPAARLVFRDLWAHAWRPERLADGSLRFIVFPSVGALMQSTGYGSRRTIQRALRELERAGLVENLGAQEVGIDGRGVFVSREVIETRRGATAGGRTVWGLRIPASVVEALTAKGYTVPGVPYGAAGFDDAPGQGGGDIDDAPPVTPTPPKERTPYGERKQQHAAAAAAGSSSGGAEGVNPPAEGQVEATRAILERCRAENIHGAHVARLVAADPERAARAIEAVETSNRGPGWFVKAMQGEYEVPGDDEAAERAADEQRTAKLTSDRETLGAWWLVANDAERRDAIERAREFGRFLAWDRVIERGPLEVPGAVGAMAKAGVGGVAQ